MKKYEFKLDPVLKIRKLKEENCRIELGKLLSQLERIENQIAYDKNEILNYAKMQESALKNGVRVDQIQSFPMLISGKEKNLELLERDKGHLQKKVEAKRQELATFRGELKVIENLKEKDYNEYRKAVNKEIDEKVEEQTLNWLLHKDKKV